MFETTLNLETLRVKSNSSGACNENSAQYATTAHTCLTSHRHGRIATQSARGRGGRGEEEKYEHAGGGGGCGGRQGRIIKNSMPKHAVLTAARVRAFPSAHRRC